MHNVSRLGIVKWNFTVKLSFHLRIASVFYLFSVSFHLLEGNILEVIKEEFSCT
jgi:hypothetical protein